LVPFTNLNCSSSGFVILVLCLFSGATFVGCTGFMMNDHGIVNIGLHMIKGCGMYANEHKAWISRDAIRPKIVKNLNWFQTFWAAKITLVNQTAIPASLHNYGMAAVNNNDTSVLSYGKSIANFGEAYTATQESFKSQGSTIASLQGQANAMQQYCMSLQHQPPQPTMRRNISAVPTIAVGCHNATGETAGAEPAINNPGSNQ
jgi:hypothetical protein